MSFERFELGLIKITLGLIAMLSVGLVANFLSLRPERATVLTASRNPSSINLEPTLPSAQAISQQRRLAPPCLRPGENHHLKSPEKRVRLTASICPKLSPIKVGSVLNKTNGFAATSFNLSPTSFTTDLIELAPGQNNILISIKNEAGKEQINELLVTY